jgi:hypothetical protein
VGGHAPPSGAWRDTWRQPHKPPRASPSFGLVPDPTGPFKTAAFNHSAISPLLGWRGPQHPAKRASFCRRFRLHSARLLLGFP